jgi:hypothetical protein
VADAKKALEAQGHVLVEFDFFEESGAGVEAITVFGQLLGADQLQVR